MYLIGMYQKEVELLRSSSLPGVIYRSTTVQLLWNGRGEGDADLVEVERF
jgi:hypothetical protein